MLKFPLICVVIPGIDSSFALRKPPAYRNNSKYWKVLSDFHPSYLPLLEWESFMGGVEELYLGYSYTGTDLSKAEQERRERWRWGGGSIWRQVSSRCKETPMIGNTGSALGKPQAISQGYLKNVWREMYLPTSVTSPAIFLGMVGGWAEAEKPWDRADDPGHSCTLPDSYPDLPALWPWTSYF